MLAAFVVDDAFVHPEPGVVAGDHLASGRVPLAVICGCAVLSPRLRAGSRAALALGLGVLAFTAGVADGVRHIAVDRFAGDDLTAVLAGFAGAGLIALGAAGLWRSRPHRRAARP